MVLVRMLLWLSVMLVVAVLNGRMSLEYCHDHNIHFLIILKIILILLLTIQYGTPLLSAKNIHPNLFFTMKATPY